MHIFKAAFWQQHRSPFTPCTPFLRTMWFVETNLERVHVTRILLKSFPLIPKPQTLNPIDELPPHTFCFGPPTTFFASASPLHGGQFHRCRASHGSWLVTRMLMARHAHAHVSNVESSLACSCWRRISSSLADAGFRREATRLDHPQMHHKHGKEELGYIVIKWQIFDLSCFHTPSAIARVRTCTCLGVNQRAVRNATRAQRDAVRTGARDS
jgi:hypothetical protein